jgi:serine/arginine repetitive matrix protein 2
VGQAHALPLVCPYHATYETCVSCFASCSKKSDVRRTASAGSSRTPDTSLPINLSELSWASPPSRGPVSQTQSAPHQGRLQAPRFLPELPSTSDFRTSVILPEYALRRVISCQTSLIVPSLYLCSLSRRFTLLRNPSGDPVSLDNLKSKFAAQRARGAEYQISEEEEDMILENLGRIRARNVGSRNTGTEDEGTDSTSTNHQASASQQSFRSSSSTTSVPTSPSGRSTKRYSNNLFGSGRFRDYTYLRSVTQQKRGSTESAKTNFTPAQVSARARADAHNSAPVVSSPQSTPESVSSGTWSPALAAPSSHLEVPTTTLLGGHRLSRNMTPAELHRASMALEEAINEIVEEAEEEFEEAEEEFEEAEEEIVMPRIPNPSRALQPTSVRLYF